MTHTEVSEQCARARRRFFRWDSILKREFALLKRNLSPMMSLIFLTQNLNMQREVDQKMALPIGTGLDELPKV